MSRASPTTYEEDVLQVIAYEIHTKDSDRKIKRRLREKKLGPWDPKRVGRLRDFKNDVQKEISKLTASSYYLGSHGPFAALEDFDIERLAIDCSARFPDIPPRVVHSFVGQAVYLYYLR